jgi:serine/threonine-protein kinase
MADTEGPRRYQTLFAELKRRHVFKVAAVYGAIAFAVMQAADFLVPALRLPEAVATGIALVAILGFPIAVALAWAFEMTPEGVKREDPAASGELEAIVAQPVRSRWPAGLLALAGTALLLGGGWWILNRAGEPAAMTDADAPAATEVEAEPRRAKLVVLPFQNLGPTEHEYFADGISEEIISRLAAIDGLGVISRTSAIQYKGTEKSLKQIGEELDVDYVLEGTILWQQRPDAPSRVRVTPQLIRVSDDTHVWADRYDAVLADIFEVQSTIAQQVIGALNVALLESERERIETRPTDNLDAYDYYLRGGDYYGRSLAAPDMESAIRLYQQAVESDSEFADAWARLSLAHLRYFWFNYDPGRDHLGLAKAAVDRALELVPGLPDAHTALGFYHYWGHLDYESALEQFEIALVAKPNDAVLWSGIAWVHRRRGDWEKSLAAMERAIELDPLRYELFTNQGMTHRILGDYEEAKPLYDRAIALSPDAVDAYTMMAILYLVRDGGGDKMKELLQAVGEASDTRLFIRQLATVFGKAALFRIDADYRALLTQLSIDELGAQKWAYYLARTGYYGADAPAELQRAYYDSARVVLEGISGSFRQAAQLRGHLGIALAGLGRVEEAIQTGQSAVDMMPVERNALDGNAVAELLAEIYMMAGEHEQAIKQLEYVLSMPTYYQSGAQLGADPFWAPLRGNPRFERLLSVN